MTNFELMAVFVPVAVTGVGVLIRVMIRLERVVTIVDRELNPNGGSSLRDRIVRMETELAVMCHGQADRVETPHRWDDPDGHPV